MKKLENIIKLFDGDIIKEIYKNAELIATLHKTLTSSRGCFFRMQLLQSLRKEQSQDELHTLRNAQGIEELKRHLNKLLDFKLIEEVSKDGDMVFWQRTSLGEEALNNVRQLETAIGNENANKIFEAYLGINSIRLFLLVFNAEKQIDPSKRDICFTSQEIGKICMFLPRTMEGYAAIDKLSDAEILVFSDEAIILDTFQNSGINFRIYHSINISNIVIIGHFYTQFWHGLCLLFIYAYISKISRLTKSISLSHYMAMP